MSATTTFAAWLVKARLKAKLTLQQLSAKSGMSPAAIHGIEHGQNRPSLDTAEKLAKALGTSLEAAVRVRGSKSKATVHAQSESVLE